MGRLRGAITVEATIVIPFYVILLVFLANFMNIFYMHQVVQFGLHNAGSVLAQYGYAIDNTIGLDKFELDDGLKEQATGLVDAFNNFGDSAQKTLSFFQKGISLDSLAELVDNGKEFANASTNLANKLRAVKGEDLVNYLVASAGEAGGGMIVKVMVEQYLDQMNVNRDLLDGDIHYSLYLSSDGHHDFILKATYCYKDPLFSIFTDGFVIEQQVAVHPWIGGSTGGLRGKIIG
mgnify:CR=1 FL=1